jgi:hypothetical protein
MSQHTYHPFQPLSGVPLWQRPAGFPPGTRERRVTAGTAQRVRLALGRVRDGASRRLHDIAPPPRNFDESLGLTPRRR